MRGLAVSLAACLAAGAVSAAPASREIAFVSNGEDGTVSLLDVAQRKVVGLLNINPEKARADHAGADNFAQDAEVSPDGRRLYVSRGYLADVAAFDIATGRMLWKAPLHTGRADHMAVSADGRTIFISALTDNAVYRIRARDGSVTGHFATGVWAHDTKFSADGRRVYNSTTGVIGGLGVRGAPPPTETPDYPYQLTIADPVSLKVLSRIKLKAPFRPWAFAPGGKQIYAELSNQRVLVAYDIGRRKVVRRLELPFPPGQPVAEWLLAAPYHGLAITPDGRTLCLAGRETDTVALVRAPALKMIADFKIGQAPGWAEVAEDGRVCLLTNGRSNDVSIVSIPDRAEVARVPVGRGTRHVHVANVPNEVIAAVESASKPSPAVAAP
jgi:DNA-binding beta-propeller fold protein YncE